MKRLMLCWTFECKTPRQLDYAYEFINKGYPFLELPYYPTCKISNSRV